MDSSSGVRGRGVVALVLGAGEGARFGGAKQLAELGGRPLLSYALEAATHADVERVIAVLGAAADEVLAGIELGRAEAVVCEEWGEGMSAALRRGVTEAGEAEAVIVILGDQPLISAAAIERVLAARSSGGSAVRATYGGVPGHPVVLERALFTSIAALRGDAGARRLLEQAEVAEVACDDVAHPLDVDHPEDLRLAELRLTPRG